MLNKKFKFSTNWKISQIIENLKGITTGNSIKRKKKIDPFYYISKYDNSGFSIIRRGYHPFGPSTINSKFIEQETKTDIFVSIKPSFGTLATFIFIIGLMFIVLFEYNIEFDLIKLITLVIIFLIPTLTVYVSYLSDAKKAKMFLAEIFEIDDLSLLKDNK